MVGHGTNTPVSFSFIVLSMKNFIFKFKLNPFSRYITYHLTLILYLTYHHEYTKEKKKEKKTKTGEGGGGVGGCGGI